MRRQDILTPDNVKSCEYYENQGAKGPEVAYTKVIGNQIFDQEMQQRLKDVLSYRQEKYGGESGKVLEVMAGQGRNFPILKQFFDDVEMLEQ